MKVLFVCSGDNQFGIVPFIKSQANGIINEGNQLDFFPISGSGKLKYLSNVLKLKKHLTKNKYGIIHAHYSFSGWTVVLSLTKTPIVLSLMGSDTYGFYKLFNKGPFISILRVLQSSNKKNYINKNSL